MAWKNQLYYGDNLEVLRDRSKIPAESVDLIYLDPPFNSKATYNVLFRERSGEESPAQIKAFEDTWHWDLHTEQTYQDTVQHGPPDLSKLLQSMREFLGTNDMMAYLTMMAPRLVEMQNVLKESGSIFLHCDPTASHYLKLVLDAVFGASNFQNEIIWHYSVGGRSKKRFARKHDVVFWYSKTQDYQFNADAVKVPMDAGSKSFGGRIETDEDGRKYRLVYGTGSKKYYKYYLDEGKIPEDVWTDIQSIQSQSRERLGYPTQKPEALLGRIIEAATFQGDVVLDPFCGCGTSIAMAEMLHRKWIGIDITHLAVSLMKSRLENTFGEELSEYAVIGVPSDLPSAEALAKQDRSEFENWAVGLLENAIPYKLRGPDGGIDGFINFFDDDSGKAKRIIIQVKSGKVSRDDIATLKGDMEREGAVIGAFITLRKPTEPMETEAAAVGFYESEHFPDRRFPKIQIRTIEQILEGRDLEYPRMGVSTLRRAERRGKDRSDSERGLDL